MKKHLTPIFAICLALAGFSAPAGAGDITIMVHDADGAPVTNAIVTLSAADVQPAPHTSTTTIIDQQHEQFKSLVSLVRPGDKVRFHNSDAVLHHVYSFAPINQFDMLVRPAETTPETLYAAAGIAAIGCNVHDDMRTYVFVTGLPFAAMTGDDGRAKILSAPAGATELSVWHPLAKGRNQTMTSAIVIDSGAQEVTIEIALRPSRRRTPSRY